MNARISAHCRALGKGLGTRLPRLLSVPAKHNNAKIPYPSRVMSGYRLGGILLSAMLPVTALTTVELRVLYEEYIEAYLVNGPRDPQAERAMLHKALKINDKIIETWWLTPSMFEWEGGVLALLAALIANKAELPMEGAVLQLEKIKLGVDVDGTVYSQYHKNLKVTPQDYTELLHTPVSTKRCSSPVYSSFYRELAPLSDFFGGREILKALTVARLLMDDAEFCYALSTYNTHKRRNASYRMSDPTLSVEAQELFTSLIKETYPLNNPVPTLWKKLVYGNVVTPRMFIHVVADCTLYATRGVHMHIPLAIRKKWLAIITRIRNESNDKQD